MTLLSAVLGYVEMNSLIKAEIFPSNSCIVLLLLLLFVFVIALLCFQPFITTFTYRR